MKLNRRNVLVGLGTIVAGGGAAIGTGAFSQVEASRTIDVDVADDSSAYVGIEEVGTRDAVDTSSDNAVQIDLSSDLYQNADGINDQATVRIGDGDIGEEISADEGCLKVVNNTDGPVDITITVSDSADLTSFTLYWVKSDGSTTGSGTSVTESSVDATEGIEFAIELETDGEVSTNPTLTVTAKQ